MSRFSKCVYKTFAWRRHWNKCESMGNVCGKWCSGMGTLSSALSSMSSRHKQHLWIQWDVIYWLKDILNREQVKSIFFLSFSSAWSWIIFHCLENVNQNSIQTNAEQLSAILSHKKPPTNNNNKKTTQQNKCISKKCNFLIELDINITYFPQKKKVK